MTQVWLGTSGSPPPPFPLDMLSEVHSSDAFARVLVVDDEPLIADTIAAILTEHGFIAQTAYGGEDAVRLAALLRPDIVVSDVLMPKMSGIQMAIRISMTLPDTRIILLSGQTSTAELMRQAAAEGHDFELLAKPIHPEELVAKLKKL